MESKLPTLNKKDYFITSIRSYLSQNAFNYTTYQGVGYLNTIFPALRKIYRDDQKKIKRSRDSESRIL